MSYKKDRDPFLFEATCAATILFLIFLIGFYIGQMV